MRRRRQFSFLMVVLVLFGAIVYVFWQEQFRYYRPVQIPEGIKIVSVNDTINLSMYGIGVKNRPCFIHFFDVSCKFSKINMEHLQLFTKNYKDNFRFLVVVMGEHSIEFLATFKDKFSVPDFVDLVADKSCSIAKACGVYSTPQAIILNTDQTLYFRGNYNSSNGLCTPTNVGTSSPAVAIRYKINNAPSPNFPSYMLLPWGCELSE